MELLDSYYFNDIDQEAGDSFREFSDDNILNSTFPTSIPNNFEEVEKKFYSIGVGSQVGQAKILGNILFKKNKFVGFIDPGSFFGHNEMEIAYLRWFNPSFIDSNFLEKYSNYIKLEKNYLDYELIYQLYYALCNVALWDKSYVEETKKILIKLKI